MVCGPPLVPRLDIPFPILSSLVNISTGKRVPRIAFAGYLETLSSQESASVSKIQETLFPERTFRPLRKVTLHFLPLHVKLLIAIRYI